MPKNNDNFFETKNHWSKIKDELLRCYLTPYFQKVLMTGKQVFYVDCFAGKGKFGDDSPGSPIIALEARTDCLRKTTQQNGKIDMCFIDLNYAEDLKANISDFCNDFSFLEIISGKYEDEIKKILLNKENTNVFLYIDPYGIKALNSSLFDEFLGFRFYTFEMLINFNSFGFFRDACRVMNVNSSEDEAFQDLDDLVEYEPTSVSVSRQSEDLLASIAGGNYWKEIVKEYKNGKINGYQAEIKLSTQYKQRLRQQYKYVLDMPIRLKPGHRPKYRMVHVCNHEDGCLLMAQNMQKRKDKLFISIQESGQLPLFDTNDTISSTIENEIMTKEQITTTLKKCLPKEGSNINITKFFAYFINHYGLLCEFKMIYTILEELEKNKLINIERTPAETKKGKPSTFWEESKDKKVVISRCDS